MKTALIVEDSKTELTMISTCLKQIGLEIYTAKSGEEALEKINHNTPDLIVLDVVLPGRSGYEICRNLKNETETSQIPIVLCSTKKTEMDKFWGMKQGADAYLEKPLDRDELIRTVKQLIERAGKSK
ncbi:MAG: response regulator [Prochloraceae cyanobacterium]|nr:response regulator [Prochloraceae cyanobacterium]